jgi:hypothetical protein
MTKYCTLALISGLVAGGVSLGHAAERLTIPQIQGDTHISPHVRTPVIFEGVVTHIFGNSFILRDEAGDGNDATSDSIIVRRKAEGLALGDRVRVEGVVRESDEGGEPRTTTDIADAVFEKLSSGTPLLPVIIGAGEGYRPPICSISPRTALTRRVPVRISTKASRARMCGSPTQWLSDRPTTLVSSGSWPNGALARPG